MTVKGPASGNNPNFDDLSEAEEGERRRRWRQIGSGVVASACWAIGMVLVVMDVGLELALRAMTRRTVIEDAAQSGRLIVELLAIHVICRGIEYVSTRER